MRYAFIKENRGTFRVTTMCRVLGVHRSGFYAWLKNPLSDRAREDCRLMESIQKSYLESFGVYGSPRIHRDLLALGFRCGRKRVARLMKLHGLKAERGYKKKKFVTGKPAVTAPNLLEQDFRVSAPNRVWVTDITYIRCRSGFVYLAAILDLYSRKIVGWALDDRMQVDIVLDALHSAIWRRKPERGLVVHSDQGSQYGSYDWINFLKCYGFRQSMSRRGNCYDNAVKESFFSSLKMERVRRTIYPSKGEARSDIFEYIEMFYNPLRRHSSIGYLSPDQFERKFPS